MALTEQMKKFALAKLKNDPTTGKQLSNKQAAIEAGYSEKSAGSKGSQLAQNPEVITYLDGLLKSGGEGAGAVFESMSLGEAAIQADMKEMESVTNSLEYLRSIYKNSRLERKVRIEAAKAALPYEFGKVGEMGIKEGREQAAGEVAKTSKFATADERRKQRENQRVS
ncbi:terminase small subunit [Acinetobacter sp. SwsAc6]|uniref:terminase small subunit n=1 Tax=Acinetobacter sp. SwsAc6 TaxID=2749439 RepID=UPI0015C0B906|nr:terminase small subunit [Acinetobacter sp. SwsAc6]NWK74146.1 terminase small subunit [Acinetobacter sp. SwsAc6]